MPANNMHGLYRTRRYLHVLPSIRHRLYMRQAVHEALMLLHSVIRWR